MPYLLRAGKRAGENVADAVGDETARLVKALWEKVGPGIEERPAARDVAQDVADNPANEPALKSLEYQLAKLLADDPRLADEVKRLLEKGQASGVVLSGGQHAETGGVIAGQIGGSVQTGGNER